MRYADKAQVQSLTGEADGVVNLYAVWRTPLSEIQKPYLEELETEFKAYRKPPIPQRTGENSPAPMPTA